MVESGHRESRPAPPSRGTQDLLSQLLTSLPDRERVLVAVDGIGASGKTTFAESLAEHARPRPVVLLHVDDFFRPAETRHARGRLSPEGFWLDTYDYEALVSWALEPLSRGGTGRYRPAAFDRSSGTPTCPAPVEAPTDALVIVEGVFLHRDELVRFWDLSVFLDVSFDEANRRMVDRGGLDESLAPDLLRRYTGAQALYFAHARPWDRATWVIDTTDPTSPEVIDPAAAHAAR